MRFTDQLAAAERLNQSLLCVGLDPEPAMFPGAWQHDAGRIFDFCATIVDATRVAILRRGTEYLVIPERLIMQDGAEVIVARHPTTGARLTLRLDEVDRMEVVK